MRRADLWTVAGREGPRPVLILQDDRFKNTGSITYCLLTTTETEAGTFRLLIQPDEENGLREESRIAIDRITTTPRIKLGKRIGRLSDQDMTRVDRAILVFLGLAGSALA